MQYVYTLAMLQKQTSKQQNLWKKRREKKAASFKTSMAFQTCCPFTTLICLSVQTEINTESDGLDGGVPLKPRKPYPWLSVIILEKKTHVPKFSAVLGVFAW